MKFVAAHDLYNNKNLSLMPDKDQVHTWPDGMQHWPAKNKDGTPDRSKPPGIINKGMRFSIGTSDKADDLTQDEKVKANWLIRGHPRSVQAVAADDKAVERIDREVKADIKKYTTEIESSKPLSMVEIIAQASANAAGMVIKQLTDAGVIKAK